MCVANYGCTLSLSELTFLKETASFPHVKTSAINKSHVRGMSLEYFPLVLGFSQASPVKVFCMQPQIPMLKSTTTRYYSKILFPPRQPWPPPLTIFPHTSRVVLKLGDERCKTSVPHVADNLQMLSLWTSTCISFCYIHQIRKLSNEIWQLK